MASDVSYTSKERELVKLQAEVTLQEGITRLAQKRLAIKHWTLSYKAHQTDLCGLVT